MSSLRYVKIPSSRPGATLNVLLCLPEGRPRAVLQMTHGMVEYIGRYEQLACWLADRGVAAVGHDHLGHGGSVVSREEYGYFGRPDGNRLLLDDIHRVTRWAKALPELEGLPWFLLGHSMGSFYARQYLCEYGGELQGAILMGTGWQPRAAARAGRALCHLLAAFHGWRYRSKLVDSMAFGGYNRSFRPARTSKDWLNRDEKEVDRYLSEERCSFRFTLNGYDSLFTALERLCDKELLARAPKDLPVLFLSGDDDPVGDRGRGVQKAAQSLRDAGMRRVEVKLYPGARHELLVELNRQEVFADIGGFIQNQIQA
ncbi:alpha/beta fold hydrolase [Faecalibacterium sp. An121]|uniref:alpha/beta fold hydrolase n=1 Tax=Faecalibacterium sp. An121 TaxID=1965550 RepID=UPI000B3870D8|nr:alpha/beta fold hydrolase [Faecalibacterium sp. An121]OUQ37245.1 alpha/beta hydrolase [Faecalibacterium sp. An121]